MPPYPDEDLPKLTLSLKEFNDIAYRLLDHSLSNAVDPKHHTFVNFVLSGRYTDPEDNLQKRINIDVLKDVTPTRDIEDFKITRDYDSIIGISNNLPFTIPIAIYPIPPFDQSLTKSNHLYKSIRAPVRQFLKQDIPLHIKLIAGFTNRQTSWAAPYSTHMLCQDRYSRQDIDFLSEAISFRRRWKDKSRGSRPDIQ